MPCTDAGPSYDYSALEKARKSLREQKTRLDDYARMLCFVCEYLPKNELEKLFRVLPDEEHGAAGEDLKAWWIAHQEHDRKRKEKEAKERAERDAVLKEEARKTAVKIAALSKLTNKLLGLS